MLRRPPTKQILSNIGELTIVRDVRGDFFDLHTEARARKQRPLTPAEFGDLDRRTLRKLAKNARRYTSGAIVVYPASHQVFTEDQAGIVDGSWTYHGEIPAEAIGTKNVALLLVNPVFTRLGSTPIGKTATFSGEPYVLPNFMQRSTQEGIFNPQTGMLEGVFIDGKVGTPEGLHANQRGVQCRVSGLNGYQFIRPVSIDVSYDIHKIDLADRQNVALGIVLIGK